MNQFVAEDQVSITSDNDEISDAMSRSNEIDSSSVYFEFFIENGLTKIRESSIEDSIIRTSFYSSMKQNPELVKRTKIVAIHKNLNSNLAGKRRTQSFQVLSKAVSDKCGGDANIKYAWYGASKDEICEILMHGFSWYRKAAAGNRECCRYSICLSPANFSLDR